MKPKEIIIITESVGMSLARDAGTFALFIALIGVGIWTGSVAMQWTGATIGFIAIITIASAKAKQSRCTIAEARARLDALEAGQ